MIAWSSEYFTSYRPNKTLEFPQATFDRIKLIARVKGFQARTRLI